MCLILFKTGFDYLNISGTGWQHWISTPRTAHGFAWPGNPNLSLPRAPYSLVLRIHLCLPSYFPAHWDNSEKGCCNFTWYLGWYSLFILSLLDRGFRWQILNMWTGSGLTAIYFQEWVLIFLYNLKYFII